MGNKKILIGVVASIFILVIVILALFLNRPVYEVTFMSNNIVIETIEVKKNSTVSRPTDPIREGYTFAGWYLENELFDFETKIKDNTTLTAKWEIETNNANKRRVTVTFDSVGGTDVDAQLIEINTTVIIPVEPVKDGYKFVEWQLDSETFDFKTQITEDITLTAKWEKVDEKEENTTTSTKYTVVFKTDGGSNVATQTVVSGKTAKKPQNPTKEGYTFKGWYYNNAEYNFNTKVTKNITLTAKWEKNSTSTTTTKYTVVFNTDGGSNVATQTIESGKTATKPQNPTKEGYTFAGWYYNNSEYDFNTQVTNNITLTAKWQENAAVTYKIEETASVTGQVIIFVLKNGEKVDGIVDITTINGNVKKDFEIPKEGYTTNGNVIKSIDNVRAK